MNSLNFHNFFVLAELYNYPNKVLILMDKDPLACVANNTLHIANPRYKDISSMMDHILFNDSKVAISTHTNLNICRMETSQHLPEVLLGYLNLLPDSIFTQLETEYLTIIMKNKLNSIEYKYFINISDNILPPNLYPWLEECFDLMQEISFNDLYSLYFLDRRGEKEQLLRSLLMLNSLGFITCLYNDTLSLIDDNKREITLTNKLFLAIYISIQLNRRNNIINIKCDNGSHHLNLSEPIDDNLKNISVSEFFFNILSGSKYTGEAINIIYTQETTNFNTIRLNLFQELKHLPAELFDDNFHDTENEYLLLLRDNDYAKHLSSYTKAGMDMIDLSILALLKSSKTSLKEVSSILPYAADEIHKSLFALIILGLVSIEMVITSEKRAIMPTEIFDFSTIDSYKLTDK